MNPDKIRNVLNILFMILALAAIITYFVAKDDFKVFIYVCGAAIFVKLMEFLYGSPTDKFLSFCVFKSVRLKTSELKTISSVT